MNAEERTVLFFFYVIVSSKTVIILCFHQTYGTLNTPSFLFCSSLFCNYLNLK